MHESGTFVRRGPSSGVPAGSPNCPRSRAEHALRLAREMLSKGRGLLQTALLLLQDVLSCCCWRERKVRPGSRRVGLLTDMPAPRGWMTGTRLLIRRCAVGSYGRGPPSPPEDGRPGTRVHNTNKSPTRGALGAGTGRATHRRPGEAPPATQQCP